MASTALPVGLELLIFIGQRPVAVHEQELAAKQAYAHCARFNGRRRIARQFNVRQQLHASGHPV
jgi:hypothetical protein